MIHCTVHPCLLDKRGKKGSNNDDSKHVMETKVYDSLFTIVCRTGEEKKAVTMTTANT